MATIASMVVAYQDQATADVQRDLIAESTNHMLAGIKLKDWVRQMTSGQRGAVVQTKVNMAKASGTITLASLIADDVITVNGVGFTAKGTAAAAQEFTLGASDTTAAAAFVAKANADTTLDGMVLATSSTSVITITALLPGELGNAVTTTISARGTASGARLAGGTNGDVERSHTFGSAT